MDPVLIGYTAKKTKHRPDWLPQVDEIASVSNCISGGLGWDLTHWRHNKYWLYDSIALVDDLLDELNVDDSAMYERYAFRLFPIVVDEGRVEPIVVEASAVEPLQPDFEFLGYDAVSRSQGTDFECSPLSCNGAAAEFAVNRYCLFDSYEAALSGAIHFSSLPYEPGPYYVVAVYRQRRGA